MDRKSDVDGILDKALFEFYNFKDQSIIEIGAGGEGRLLKQYVSLVKRAIVTEIECMEIANLERLITENNWSQKVRLFTEPSLRSLDEHVDAVLMCFAFHEVDDKSGMLFDIKSVADRAIVLDFGLNTEWIYLTKEEEKVKDAWKILEKAGFARSMQGTYRNWFKNYDALHNYVVPCSKDPSRLKKYRNKTNFIIESAFRLVELAN